MNLFQRMLAVCLLTVFAMFATVPVMAAPMILATAEEAEPSEEEAPGPAVEYDGPAAFLDAEVDAVEEDIPQWTYQYLVPGTIVLVMLMTIALGVGYFIRVVGKRYTIVE